MFECFALVYARVISVCNASREQKRAVYALELELLVVVNCHVGAKN